MKKYLHIVAFDPLTNKSATRATCVLEDGSNKVDCTGDEQLVTEMNLGYFHPGKLKTVTPNDGEPFFQALALEYRRPELFATDVYEGETVEPYQLPEPQAPGSQAA